MIIIYTKRVFILILIFCLPTILPAQNNIKDMIKRALNEKSFMKIQKNKTFNGNIENNKSLLKLRSGDIGESLVEDSKSGSESELFAAINPNDSNNIVVAVIHFSYSQISEKALSISIYYSNDFGETWDKSPFNGIVDQNAIVLGGGDPVLVFDAKGNLHLTYIMLSISDFISFKSNEHINHAVSSDGGKSWTTNNYFKSKAFSTSDVELTGLDRFLDKQWMVADLTNSPFHGNVYMGFVDFNIQDSLVTMEVDVIEPNDTSFVYNPIKVTSDSFKFVQFASVDINNNGDFFISYVGSYDSLHYSLYNSISIDGAKSFSEPRKISDFYYPGFSVYSEKSSVEGIVDRYFPSPYIAIDRSNGDHEGRIYATWTSPGFDTVDITGSDIYLTYSDDNGLNWNDPIIVNNDALNNSDQFYSNLEVNGIGIPILCFYDKRNDAENNHHTDYYITYSLDLENLSFSTQFPLTKRPSDFSKIGNKTGGFGIGEYNKTISTNSYAIPFWADGRKNNGDLNVYMALIPLNGKEPNVGFQEINLINEKIQIKSIDPNPNNGDFNIKFSLKSISNISFDLFNLKGEKIYYKNLGEKNIGDYNIHLSLSDIKNGVYLMRINSKFGITTKKLIIDKK